jgi:hypothetical protein
MDETLANSIAKTNKAVDDARKALEQIAEKLKELERERQRIVQAATDPPSLDHLRLALSDVDGDGTVDLKLLAATLPEGLTLLPKDCETALVRTSALGVARAVGNNSILKRSSNGSINGTH